jgi:hypothetical protein
MTALWQWRKTQWWKHQAITGAAPRLRTLPLRGRAAIGLTDTDDLRLLISTRC